MKIEIVKNSINKKIFLNIYYFIEKYNNILLFNRISFLLLSKYL